MAIGVRVTLAAVTTLLLVPVLGPAGTEPAWAEGVSGVDRCTGRDLLVRDPVSGTPVPLGPASGPYRVVPVPEGFDPDRIECFDGYILRLETPPLAGVAGSGVTAPHRARIESEQLAALEAIASVAPGAEVVRRFSLAFNGLHVRMPIGAAAELRRRGLALSENTEVHALLDRSVPLINADDVWAGSEPKRPGITGRGATIAVIDTGIDYSHPDLGNGCFGVQPDPITGATPCKVIGGYDVSNGDPDPLDDHGHGTHVAAIAAGSGSSGPKGVAPAALLYAFKVLDKKGSGTYATVMEGIERALDPNGDLDPADAADVLNLSLGGSGDPDDPLSRAVDAAVASGAVVVVAAGNRSVGAVDDGNISSPGTARSAITVGASTKEDAMAGFSSRGPVIWGGKAIVKPDLVAPGASICAAWPQGATPQGEQCGSIGLHTRLSGTSMAAPHVAGVAALLEQGQPGLTPEEVRSTLKGTTVNLALDRSAVSRGTGRVDALRAYERGARPPVARLEPIATTGATRTIRGTVGAGSLRTWTLSVAAYGAPHLVERNWTEVFRSSTRPAGAVLRELGTGGLRDGRYLLRLTVEDTGGRRAVDHGYLEVERIGFTDPLPSDVLRGGDTIDVASSVDPSLSVTGLRLEYGAGSEPSSWSLIADGSAAARWDTSGLAAGAYTLRLIVAHDGLEEQETIRVSLDPTLAPSFPIRVPAERGPGWVDPVAADLDGDGGNELLFLRFGSTRELTVYGSDGALRWRAQVGRAASPDWITALDFLHLPVVGDTDGDGSPEIFVYDNVDETMFVYTAEGALRSEWPVALGGPAHLARLIMADVTGDGVSEVLISAEVFDPALGDREKIAVLSSSDGSLMAHWFVSTAPRTSYRFVTGGYGYMPAVGNLDDDPQLEIVAVDDIESMIRAFDPDGRELRDPLGWPVRADRGSVPNFAPVIGDLDSDGSPDVLAGTIFGETTRLELHAVDRRGRPLAGWPLRSPDKVALGGPAIADLDGNGDLEVVLNHQLSTAVYHHDGKVASGWPVTTYGRGEYPAVIADVDGDGRPDIVVHEGSSVSGLVRAWHADGSAIPGFSRPMEPSERSAILALRLGDGGVATVATSDSDFFLDNRNRMVSKGRYSIHLWAESTPWNDEAMPWPTYQANLGRTGNVDGMK